MNCSLLEDDEYSEEMSKMISLWLEEGYKDLPDHLSTWDWLKYNIRVFSIRCSKKRVKQKNDREAYLENECSKAKGKFEAYPN